MTLNSRVKTLTVDNCKEFADHQAIDQALSIKNQLCLSVLQLAQRQQREFQRTTTTIHSRESAQETVTEEKLTMIEKRSN
jgi:IS30 family transposase